VEELEPGVRPVPELELGANEPRSADDVAVQFTLSWVSPEGRLGLVVFWRAAVTDAVAFDNTEAGTVKPVMLA